jgi:hypothetical protein
MQTRERVNSVGLKMDNLSPFAAIPISRSERWALLTEVAAQWYAPLEPSDGIAADQFDFVESRLGVPIPVALREWYTLAGSRNDIWSRQDHFLPPNEFRVKNHHLVFLIENQDVVEWGMAVDDLGMDDPPVFVTSLDDESIWLRENDSISEFALQLFASNLKWSNNTQWWANAYVSPNVVDKVAGRYPRLPFAEWHWPAPMRFYGNRDFLAEVQAEPDGEDGWLYAVANSVAAADEFKRVVSPLNIAWEVCSEEWPAGWVSQ